MQLPGRLQLQARGGARDRRDRHAGRSPHERRAAPAAPGRGAAVTVVGGAAASADRGAASACGGRSAGDRAVVARDGMPGPSAPRLTARLMRAAARGGWVNGSLMWSGLDSWHVQGGGYRSDHLALVRELYAVHGACAGHGGYYYGRCREDARPQRMGQRAAMAVAGRGGPARSCRSCTRSRGSARCRAIAVASC